MLIFYFKNCGMKLAMINFQKIEYLFKAYFIS